MTPIEALRREFEADENTFLLQVRVELRWDWEAFRRLTNAMYDVAEITSSQGGVEKWVAEGFWHCDTWLVEWTSHPSFPPDSARPAAIELIHDLAYFFFRGQSPYIGDQLRKKVRG